MAAAARSATATERWLSQDAGHVQQEEDQHQQTLPAEADSEETLAIGAGNSLQDTQHDLPESLRESLEAAKLSALIPILVKLGVEEADDLRHVHGADLEKEGAKVVQARKFEEWKQRVLPDTTCKGLPHAQRNDVADLSKPALVRRRSGVEMEEYCGRVMEHVLGFKVGKPAPRPRLQVSCDAHKHGKVDSNTSQPDFLVVSPGGQKLVVEVKDYTAKVKKSSLDKLLSDKISHQAEHALLVLGPLSRLGDGCRQTLREHQVNVVEFRKHGGDPHQEDQASFAKALEEMGLHSLLGRTPADVGAVDTQQEARFAELAAGMAQLRLTETPKEPSRAPSSSEAAQGSKSVVLPGAHHEGPVKEQRPTPVQPLAVEKTPGSESEDDDDDEGELERGDAGDKLLSKAGPRSDRFPRVTLGEDGSVTLDSEEFHLRREAHDLFDAAGTGWQWLLAKIDRKCAPVAQAGLQYAGRCYYLVSVSKGSYNKPATVWCASPPNGAGPEAVERVLGWGQRFQLKAPTLKRPYPLFMLRSRVKQLFSCSLPLMIPGNVLKIKKVPDIKDQSGLVRTDGCGEIDPDLLQKGFDEEEPHEGTRRRLPWSAQIRDGGVKGMVSASERLRGTGILEVRDSMWKFDKPGPQLRVVTFSVVRRTALNLNFLLRLQALGVDQDVFKAAQRKVLDKLMGPRTRKEAARLLQVDLAAAGSDWYRLSDRGANYLGSFAAVLLAGFDVDQHPLLTILERHRDKELQSAGKRVSLEGCWSCRGVPESADAEGHRFLKGNQIFCTVPDSDGGWRVLTGRVLVGQPQDLDPSALRLAEAIDSPELRKSCGHGVLYFSVEGQALQADLGWDFDGDYYVVIENEDLVPKSLGIYAPATKAPQPQPSPPSRTPEKTPSLAEVNGHFLQEFADHDHMGLLHFKWQCVAGQGPRAAADSEARKLAALYGEAVDVEKGGRRPTVPKIFAEKWDFMKGSSTNKSPTVAGEVFRMAAQALSRRSSAEPGANHAALKPDIHLEDEWTRAKARLPQDVVDELADRARALRSDLVEHVKKKIEADEADYAQDNPSNMALAEEQRRMLREWMDQTRDKQRRDLEAMRVTLEDFALVCWHTKYVRDNVASRVRDPDQFPWTLFGAELCSIKERGKICTQAEGERRRLMLLDIKGLASAAEEQGANNRMAMRRLREALSRLSTNTWHCKTCAAGAAAAHAALLGRAADGSAKAPLSAVVLEDIQRIRKGVVHELPVSELRYTKAAIQAHFQYGVQAGQRTEELVLRLLGESCKETLNALRLYAVRYHGEVYVVEGNRRLWALHEAERRTGVKLAVRVEIQDLHMGLIYGRPAVRMFWERYDPRHGGTKVDLVEVAEPLQPPVTTQPDAASAAQGHTVARGTSTAAAPRAATGRAGGPATSGNTRMDFGKYKGRTFDDVRRTEAGYCNYVLQKMREEGPGCKGFADFAGYLQSFST